MIEETLTSEPNQVPPPHLRRMEEAEDYALFVIEPLEAGTGITLGNALRRVLLRSLLGAAVVAVKIGEVRHDFSTIPHVKEDAMDFLFNVKQIRLRPITGRPGQMTLEVSGEGQVSAGDIQTSADFEVINPELILATMDSAEARLAAEFQVELGKGFRPAESNPSQSLGVIPIDAIFTPIKKVNYKVEPTRVGQDTSYDKLTLEIWTDGTITPAQALSQGASILIDQLALFLDLDKALEKAAPQTTRPSFLTEEQYLSPLEKLGLQPRTFNALRRSGISTVGQVVEKTPQDLLKIRHFGEKAMAEVREQLKETGLLPPEWEAQEVASEA